MATDTSAWLERLARDAPARLELNPTAVAVLSRRYLARDGQGNVAESPEQMLVRVSKAAAEPEKVYGGDPVLMAEIFRLMMIRREFLPNTPTLTNSGRPRGQLAACFVLPVENSILAMDETVRQMTAVQQTGGGTGFSFSGLGPSSASVPPENGQIPGPLQYLRTIDDATSAIGSGDTRHGANMGILAADHPDILEFITAKLESDRLTNFNISVAISDFFMHAATGRRDYALLNPLTGKETGRLDASKVLKLLSGVAWLTGDPGVIFIDQINRDNPTPHLGRVESTNPCGEIPLLPYESCNLGSINLAGFVRNGTDLDWDRLKTVTRASVRFLDNIIDANAYTSGKIHARTTESRKIGLGVMGFADALIRLNVAYQSDEALGWADRIMRFVATESKAASTQLAEERGPFPAFNGSRLDRPGLPPMRNATVNSIAPTGTLSILAGCSPSIEPLFALTMTRTILNGKSFVETHPLLRPVADRFGVWSDELASHVARIGSLEGLREIPELFLRLFKTAHQIPASHHVRMQAAFQKHVDNAVSKTVNLPSHASPLEVEKAIRLAWQSACKGITVFRDGCRKKQVLEKGTFGDRVNSHPEAGVSTPPAACPDCGNPTLKTVTFRICLACGWSNFDFRR